MNITNELAELINTEINQNGRDSAKKDIGAHHMREITTEWLRPLAYEIRKYRNHVSPDPAALVNEALAYEDRKRGDNMTEFMLAAQNIIDSHSAKDTSGTVDITLTKKRGPKWTKIIATRGFMDNDTVWAFVNNETGDIHKPAGWKRPAKHARGNINAPDFGASCLTPYGPVYLK